MYLQICRFNYLHSLAGSVRKVQAWQSCKQIPCSVVIQVLSVICVQKRIPWHKRYLNPIAELWAILPGWDRLSELNSTAKIRAVPFPASSLSFYYELPFCFFLICIHLDVKTWPPHMSFLLVDQLGTHRGLWARRGGDNCWKMFFIFCVFLCQPDESWKRLVIKATCGFFWRPRGEGATKPSPDDNGDDHNNDDVDDAADESRDNNENTFGTMMKISNWS